MPHRPFGLPKRLRLGTRREYDRVFRRPFRSSDALFTVLAAPNGTAQGRLGLAIARKHVRLAVQRNRIKRLVREGFRHRRRELAGLDLVLLARKGVGSCNNVEIRHSLEGHWRRLAGCSRA